ncbi:MAG: hypothetical protein ACPGES_01745 [Coraliomargarita sp.]
MIKIISGAFIFIIGSMVFPALVIFSLIAEGEKAKAFRAPGMIQIEATEPGRYILWNDYVTVFEGQRYKVSEDLPNGMRFSITTEGSPLEFTSDTFTTTQSGSNASRSVGYVTVEAAPITLDVEVTGNTQPRIFSFGQSRIAEFIIKISGILLIGLISTVAGIGLIIWGAMQLSKQKD